MQYATYHIHLCNQQCTEGHVLLYNIHLTYNMSSHSIAQNHYCNVCRQTLKIFCIISKHCPSSYNISQRCKFAAPPDVRFYLHHHRYSNHYIFLFAIPVLISTWLRQFNNTSNRSTVIEHHFLFRGSKLLELNSWYTSVLDDLFTHVQNTAKPHVPHTNNTLKSRRSSFAAQYTVFSSHF